MFSPVLSQICGVAQYLDNMTSLFFSTFTATRIMSTYVDITVTRWETHGMLRRQMCQRSSEQSHHFYFQHSHNSQHFWKLPVGLSQLSLNQLINVRPGNDATERKVTKTRLAVFWIKASMTSLLCQVFNIHLHLLFKYCFITLQFQWLYVI